MKNKQKHYHPVLGIVILLIIAAFVAWDVRRPDSGNSVEENSIVNHDAALETNEQGATVPKLKNAINVSDQAADTSIDIDYLSLQDPGFVVIHGVENGQPGKIIAKSGLIGAGTKQDLLVPYTTTPGTTYYAMLHSDDGDGVFNMATDLPLIGSDTHPVMDMFVIVQ